MSCDKGFFLVLPLLTESVHEPVFQHNKWPLKIEHTGVRAQEGSGNGNTEKKGLLTSLSLAKGEKHRGGFETGAQEEREVREFLQDVFQKHLEREHQQARLDHVSEKVANALGIPEWLVQVYIGAGDSPFYRAVRYHVAGARPNGGGTNKCISSSFHKGTPCLWSVSLATEEQGWRACALTQRFTEQYQVTFVFADGSIAPTPLLYGVTDKEDFHHIVHWVKTGNEPAPNFSSC